ncbi:homeobox protein Hox-A7 isoform X2 [Peromyscus maniculatus bairdii]|uniref:homeobox protein Hox-A7 isoform X2 n=1 Tax=Peromyscus maniculatus bairdii TaxID=230844 RepID=UPI003FD3CFC7
MSSSYYVNALFSKYTAGASLFQNAEPTSCSFAPNSQRSGYGPGAGAFASTVPGLYNVNSPLYQSPFASGYGLGADAYNLPCASYDQNIPGLCSDLAKGACDKADEGVLHGPAEASFRIYPWMRSSASPLSPFFPVLHSFLDSSSPPPPPPPSFSFGLAFLLNGKERARTSGIPHPPLYPEAISRA